MRGIGPRLVVIALVAACGPVGGSASYEQSRTATQILGDADLAMISSRSYHVSIDETAEVGRASADVDVEGANVSGTIIESGIRARIVHVSDQTFIYGSDLAQALYITDPRTADKVNTQAHDKWVLVPPETWKTGFGPAIDLRGMSSCVKRLSGVVKKQTTSISGQAAVKLQDPARAEIYVETAAPHHYVRLWFPTAHGCATDATARSQLISLTRYGARFNITAPTGYVGLKALAAS